MDMIAINQMIDKVKQGCKLNMSNEDFVKAVLLIATSKSCKALFLTPVTNNYGNVYAILIQESNAAIINTLIDDGYSLSMTPKGLSVNKY